MCSNIVIAMRFKDFQLTTSSTGINTEFKNTSGVHRDTNNESHIMRAMFQQQQTGHISPHLNSTTDDESWLFTLGPHVARKNSYSNVSTNLMDKTEDMGQNPDNVS